MRYLIDGYNLLHAVGWAPNTRSHLSLEASRRKFLDWMAGIHRAGDVVQVVFDASKPTRSDPVGEHRGIRIEFVREGTADDRLEELIRLDPLPRRLTVVSSDNRIRLAAERRGCIAWSCKDYLDAAVAEETRKPAPPTAEEKPVDGLADAEFLKAFGEPKDRLAPIKRLPRRRE